MCPGQGAQKVGMGKDLAERFPAARDTFAAIDDALETSLSRLMWTGPEDELTLTHNAQPAILAHSVAVLAVVGERLGTPCAGAGHSLGEYSAHVGAGTLSPVEAARLVRRRGELMLEAGRRRPGTMAAVLGLATEEVEAACDESSGPDGLAVAANLNAPDQTVISGDPPGVARAGEACKARGAKRVIALNVSGAFHSPLMAPAVDGLLEALTGATFADPGFSCDCQRQWRGDTDRPRRQAPVGRPADGPGSVGCVHAGGRGVLSRCHVRRGGSGSRSVRSAQAHRAGSKKRRARNGG